MIGSQSISISWAIDDCAAEPKSTWRGCAVGFQSSSRSVRCDWGGVGDAATIVYGAHAESTPGIAAPPTWRTSIDVRSNS